MKRIICLITALCLILGSFSFCFGVDWSSTDQQNLSNAASRLYYNNQSAAYYIYQIYTRLGTLSNTVTDIKNALFDSNHSIAYWVSAINSWMQPIYTSITSSLVSETDIIPIISGLNEVVSDGTNTTYYPFLKYGGKSAAQWLSDLNTKDYFPFNITNAGVHWFGPNGQVTLSRYNWTGSNWMSLLLRYSAYDMQNEASEYQYRWAADLTGYNSSQTALNWTDLDSQYTFTPSSSTDGIYKWFATLQAPVARLSYVLASDERIAAQEAAAANEEAVVDNFIDSTGNGSASPSDIGSISDLSSGYKNNFGSDASVSGIFNIFNSNNMGWFSQETANQLDTTQRSRSSFATPLLDQKIQDIYDQIGVIHD